MADAYDQLARYDEALAWAHKYQQISGDSRLRVVLQARMCARMGKRTEAAKALRTLEKNGDNGEFALAGIYSALGDHDRAIAALERGVQTHSFLPFVFVDPQLDPLRSDPRFQQLLRRVGLPS